MIDNHMVLNGADPESFYERGDYNQPDPDVKRCATFCVVCFRDAHPESQSGECAIHTLIGWAEELKRSQWDQEIQSEFAAWTARAAKEMGK